MRWVKKCGIAALVVAAATLGGCANQPAYTGVPEPYNLTIIANSSGVTSLTSNINDILMFNTLGILILLATFTLSFLAGMRATNNSAKSFLGSAFIAFVLSVLLRILDLVPDAAVYGLLAVVAVSAALTKRD